MIPFFSRMPDIAAPVLWPKRWGWICSGLLVNLERVETYYRLYPPAVASSHFLVKLLMSIEVPMSLPVERYYDAVDARAKGLSMQMLMTSPYFKGKAHDGIFYGAGCSEVLLLDEDFVDYLWVHDNWQEACPVKVLMHPKSDLRMLLPNGKSYSGESGLCVLSINIAMLALMYRAFCLSQLGKPDPLSIYQFIGGWVLPNILAEHIDLALFNQYYNKAFYPDKPTAVVTRQHSFRMPNYEPYVEQAVNQVVSTVHRQHKNFLATLRGMPAITAHDMTEVLEMPDVYPTVQDDWALFASRAKAVRLLLKLCEPTAHTTDQATLNRIVRAYAQNNVPGMIRQQLPQELALEFFEDIAAMQFFNGVGEDDMSIL